MNGAKRTGRPVGLALNNDQIPTGAKTQVRFDGPSEGEFRDDVRKVRSEFPYVAKPGIRSSDTGRH